MVKYATAGCLLACLFSIPHAFAGVTSVNIGASASVTGENWAMGQTWYIRGIVVDASGATVGKLSDAAQFNTKTAALTPENVTVTIDDGILIGPKIRLYRSNAPFSAGDNVQFADFDVCPCAKGEVQLTVDKHLPNGRFSSAGAALPVQLQEFSVD